jgi:hypothetical protein
MEQHVCTPYLNGEWSDTSRVPFFKGGHNLIAECRFYSQVVLILYNLLRRQEGSSTTLNGGF